MTTPRIGRLCIVGVGLIGGSLARALRRAGAVERIVGAGRNLQSLQRARELGVIDESATDIAAAAEGADVVVLAVPLGAMRAAMRALRPVLRTDMILTDVGSAKGSVVDDAVAAFDVLPPGFVPGHPIAGTEKSGVEHSFADLYAGRRVILTPTPASAPDAVARVRALWAAAGAEVECMDIAHHDRVLAATSHLPHLLAYALVDMLAGLPEGEEIFRYAAGGFRDFTRIASSDPVMWRDICRANGAELGAMIARYRAVLDLLAEAVTHADGARLQEIFGRAKQARDRHYSSAINESPE